MNNSSKEVHYINILPCFVLLMLNLCLQSSLRIEVFQSRRDRYVAFFAFDLCDVHGILPWFFKLDSHRCVAPIQEGRCC